MTITLHHLLLSRCSIGHEKPLMIFRFDQGSRLVVNDTYLLQPDGLCLPIEPQQSSTAFHQARPAAIPGVQTIRVGQPQAWCAGSSGTRTTADTSGTSNADGDRGISPNVDRTSSTGDNNSYSLLPPLPQEFANRTGLGPAYAATLDQPAVNPFYTHRT